MWSTFEAATNEDETVNNKFCENGLFKIKNEDESANKDPKVQATLQNKKMLVAVDNNLFLLEDETACHFLSFGSQIDCISVSLSGDLAVVGLADGNVHGIHIKGVPVFTLTIDPEDIGVERTFVGITQENEFFYLMCSNGKIYKLINIDEKLLSESLFMLDENETLVCNKTLLNNTILEKISNKRYVNVECFCLISMKNPFDDVSIQNENPFNNTLIIGCGRTIIFQTAIDNLKCEIPDSYGTAKVICNLDDFVLCLTTSGRLLKLCPFTQMYYLYNFNDNALIDDFMVMVNDGEDIELLVLTKLLGHSKRTMRIVEFPTMLCKYELSMPDIAWLVRQPKSSMNMYYLSGSKNDTPLIQEIEMKIISETEPSQRLLKLIQRGHLVEAEEFAKQFTLSLQPIFEAKARRLLMDIGSGKNNRKLNETVETLLEILKSIESKEFFVNIRGMDIPDRTQHAKFLQFLLESINSNDYPDDVDEIHENLLRLDTLKLIDPYECELDWQNFVHKKNLLLHCKEMFKTDISIACLIWTRHLSTILPHFEIKNMIKLLNAVPNTIEPFQIIQWLKHIVPSILQCYPHLMKQLVEWSIQKTRSLQYSKLWPEIGLEFGNNVLQIFTDVHFLMVDIRRQYETNIDKIQSLIVALEDLSVLKRDYNLSLTLDDYIKEKIEDTAVHLLQRVQLNSLPKMVNGFLNTIFMEKGLSPEESIIRYIKYLCTNKMTSWQERALVCIELLTNEESKLSCVLLVLKASPVPISEVLNPLLKYATVSHPLASEIFIEYKSQIIKIIKAKYNWPIDYKLCSYGEYMKLIYRIMKVNLPEMLADIKSLIKAADNIGDQANFYCIYELTKRGQIEKAVQYLDQLDEGVKQECCERTTNIIMDILNEEELESTKVGNFIEILKIMDGRMKVKSANNSIKQLEQLRILRTSFKLDVFFFSLNDIDNKKHYLTLGIDYIIHGLQLKKNDNYLDDVWSDVNALCKALEISSTFGLYKFAFKLNNLHMTCAVVKLLLATITIERYNFEDALQLVHLLLVQQMLLTSDAGMNDPLAYPLAHKLLQECLKVPNLSNIEITELIKWTRIGHNLYENDLIEKVIATTGDEGQMILKQIFISANESLSPDPTKSETKRASLSVFEKVQTGNVDYCQKNNDPENILTFLGLSLKVLAVGIIKPLNACFGHINEIMEELSLGDFSHEDVKREFYEALEKLVKSKNYSLVFTVMQFIMKHQDRAENNVIVISHMFASMLCKKTLKFILSQKEPDHLDALIVLLSDTNQLECMKYLEENLKNGSQKIAYITLSEMYYTIKGDLDRVALERESRIKYFYYTELCKIDSSLKNKNMECTSIQSLLKDLRNKILDVGLLKKLSEDFNLDYQSILVTQVVTLLKTQEQDFTVFTDVFGNDTIAIRSSVEEIIAICQPYINEISKRELLNTELRKFAETINFYFYEMYLAVFQILKHINCFSREMEVHMKILLFLKNKMTTKRRNRLSQIETDLFMHSQSDAGVMPKISKYRLPFMPLITKPLKYILDNEVNVDNIERWFPLIKLCDILSNEESTHEYFCMSAVKNSIQENKLLADDTKTDVWNLKPVDNSFLQSILRLIKHMQDKSKIIFILYFVINYSPEGADAVAAAHEAYKFVLQHEGELYTHEKTKTSDMADKIKRKYPSLKTQHLLHFYKLYDEKLVKFVEHPMELIHALYHHESIMKQHKPDINKLAAELAELHNIDLYGIQLTLLRKWLDFSTTPQMNDANALEETFYEDFITCDNDCSRDDGLGDEFVARAHYILSSWSSEESVQLLITELKSDGTTNNTGKQLQIFECFIKLINDSTSPDLFEMIHQNNFVVIKCVHYLKQLGYKLSQEHFSGLDKLSFLKQLWQQHANNGKALEVMAYICLGFEVYVPQIWNGILKQMVRLNMFQQLSALVNILSANKSLLHIPGLTLAWEYVIKEPFKSANRSKSFEQEAVLSKAFLLLQTCPVATNINLLELAETCVGLRRPHMAAIFIAYAKNEVKEKIMKMVIAQKSDTIKKDILEMEEHGIIPVITNFVINELKL